MKVQLQVETSSNTSSFCYKIVMFRISQNPQSDRSRRSSLFESQKSDLLQWLERIVFDISIKVNWFFWWYQTGVPVELGSNISTVLKVELD